MMSILRNPYLWMGLGIAVIVTLQITAPKPISWEYTYESDDKNPFGGWIPAHYLERTFEGEMRTLKNVMWSEADTEFGTETTKRTDGKPTSSDTYVVVTHNFEPDTEAQRLILDVVRKGGTLFIAADEIGDSLAKEIGIKARSGSLTDTITFRVGNVAVDSNSVVAGSPTVDSNAVAVVSATRSYAMAGFDYANTFAPLDSTSNIDSNTWMPLAFVDTLIAMTTRKYGSGSIILCGTPDLLTNKAFLDTATRTIPITILSALPDKPIVWDEYYKPKRSAEMTVNRAIGSIPGLSLAYWLLICTGIVYLIMAGRRRQRPIPIIHPVRNTSLDFVSTVGRLYYGRHDNLNLANKLSRLFRDYVVNRLRLRVDVDAQTLAENISSASGADIVLVSSILRRISHADSGLEFSDTETVAFHNDIQAFQQQSTI